MKRSMRRDYRGVCKPVGAVLGGLGVALLLCAAAGALFEWALPARPTPQSGTVPLLLSAGITIAAGVALFLYGRRHSSEKVHRREAVLSVTLIWGTAGLFGALPFVFSGDLGPIDALFEAISGLTTTGATVIEDIDRVSRPILLWRSLIQWLGGMGIVVLFVAVFPSVGAGGKHMFKGEVPGAVSEGLQPRIGETSITLWKLYAALTALEIALLYGLGMDLFEATCHGFTTMSTGGFSTENASLGAFSPTIQYVVAGFMLVGAANYGLYYGALRGRSLRVIARSVEFKAFVGLVIISVAAVAIINLGFYAGDAELTFRNSLFTVATVISSTGYGTHDYSVYPPLALTVMLILMFVGGCSGSTAGGIKIERLVLMAKQAWAQIRNSYEPNVVYVVRIGRRSIDKSTLADVTSMFGIYMATMGVGILVVSAIEGIHPATAFGAMLTCLSNMGPAPFHELENLPDNFVAYRGVTKIVFSLAMLLGRLEFFTMLSLLVPGFWKR